MLIFIDNRKDETFQNNTHMYWMKSSYLMHYNAIVSMNGVRTNRRIHIEKNRWLHFNNNVHSKMSSIENGFLFCSSFLSFTFSIPFIQRLEGCTLAAYSHTHSERLLNDHKKNYRYCLVYLALKRTTEECYLLSHLKPSKRWGLSLKKPRKRWNRTMNYDNKSYIFG